MSQIKPVVIEKHKIIFQEDTLSVALYVFSDSHEFDASMERSQFLTEKSSTRKKFSIRSPGEEIKPVVSELFEIENRENLD